MSPSTAFAIKPVCQDWFKNGKIFQDENCLTNCVRLEVGMGTFMCGTECPDLCNAPAPDKFVFKLSNLYPGLTLEERALSSKEPVKVLQAYQLSWKAQNLCAQIYSTARTNDESDACRHFVWAALLTQKLGGEFAGKVLDAHEMEPRQPEPEKAMDLANNRRGILDAEKLTKDKGDFDAALLQKFREELSGGRLIVLRPRKK